MSYVIPQVLVYQDFQAIPDEITDPLRAWIVGPNAELHRYTDTDEKPTINVGSYDSAVDTTYSYPGRTAGSLVDQDYVRVFIDDALLLYYHDPLSDGETINPVSGYSNRVETSTLAFKDNGDSYPRSAAFLDRDVQAGDTVYLRGVVSGQSYELWTYVRGFVAEVVAAVVGDAFVDGNNTGTQTSVVSVQQLSGVTNCLSITADISLYDGRADGGVNDVYTVLVTEGSSGGDLTTATLRVISATGDDDVLEFTPAAAESTKTVGDRGLKIGFTVSGTGSSCSSDSPESAEDLVAGQKFQVTVQQAFEAAIARSGGTYSGTTDTTYIVEVTRGGVFGAADPADRPQITVSTTHGSDYSGPTLVSQANTLYPIGTKGVKIRFGGSEGLSSYSSMSGGSLVGNSEYLLDDVSGLRKGDKFYIPVTAASSGRYGTLILGHNMSDDLLAASDLELKLFIKKDIEVTAQRVEAPPNLNFELEATQIIVKAGITSYDSSWTDGGVEQPLPVEDGTVYIHYREWLANYLTTVEGIQDVGDLDDQIAGPLDVDNPLKWAVYNALNNASGTTVKYSGVQDPDDVDEWLAALELVVGRDDVYCLVPLTRNQTVLNAFAGHVTGQSSAENGRWRALFVSLQAEPEVVGVSDATSSDTGTVLATLDDDPEASGTQYTLLAITSGNANMVELGVAAGDTVRYLYQTDGFGTVTYTEFIVDAVINETELRLFSGHTVPIAVPQKVEIWHTRSKTEVAQELATTAGTYGSSRVCAVWPDTVSAGGVEMEGYHLCAGLAGLVSGVPPHQGLTNVELIGYDDLTRTTEYFNATQLNLMAEAGVWIVTQDNTGSIISRHALTTDTTDVSSQEEMVRRNVDAISYLLAARLRQFIGRSNVTPTALALIRVQLVSAIEYLKANGFTERLGGQLIEANILEIRPHTLLPDRVVVTIDLTIPYPMNNIEVHLVI